ncbi:methyl-accepting chemotaxis protein [Sulfurimonas sp.]|uniref:HAMP domain-containing protein n=1 Tax=Sulfurimonas sp. TaxID=2022749 RepID=UPI0025FD7C50|nr:methyl-accepting chemotaxis protein [Sulfurimonas sp.]MCK9473772.1 methyl-accepting chemotaxis protein [Sulfurimonas sp.]
MGKISELENLKYEVKSVESSVQMLRRNEKDFLSRHDLKYHAEYNENFEKLIKSVDRLHIEFESNSVNADKIENLKNILEDYSKNFTNIVLTQQKVGLGPKDGLYGSLRESVHNLEDLLNKNQNYKLHTDILMLRRAEKDFMLRSDLTYFEKFNKSLNVFLADLKDAKSSEYNQVLALLNAYSKDFHNLVGGYKEIGLTQKDGMLGEMRETIHKVDELLSELSSSADAFLDEKNRDIKKLMLVIFSVLLVTMIVFALIVIKKINSQIKTISDSVNKITKTKDISSQIIISGKDELSMLAKNLNIMFVELRGVIADAKNSSIENSSISHELSTTSMQVGRNVEESVEIINETTKRTTLITDEF